MMTYVEARHYSSASDMLAKAKAIRDRLTGRGKPEQDRVPRHTNLRCEFIEDLAYSKARAHSGMTKAALARAERAKKEQAAAEAKRKFDEQVAANKAEQERLIAEAAARVEAAKAAKEAAKEARANAAKEKRKSLKREELNAIRIAELAAACDDVEIQIRRLCSESKFLYSEIIGSNRKKELVKERYAIMKAIAEANPQYSVKRIATAFGNKDHTCVRNALIKLGCPSRGFPEPSGQVAS